MNIPLNAHIDCSDGSFGRSAYIILQPNTLYVTHVVARSKHGAQMEYLVPVELVDESTPETLLLRCSRAEVAGLPVFAETDYILADEATYVPGGNSMLWPGTIEEPIVLAKDDLHVPEGEIALIEGAVVVAKEGIIGKLGELMVDDNTHQVTDFVLREGHFWHHREIVIPMSAVDHIESTAIYLKLTRQEIEQMPPDRRHYSLS